MSVFQISGEYITDHMRNLFQEKDFNSVYEFFTTTFKIDKTDNIDVVVSILKGEQKFVGINDLELIDDDINSDEIQDYLEELNYRYYNLYNDNGIYYRLCAEIYINEINSAAKKEAKYEFYLQDKQLNKYIIINGKYYNFDQTVAYYVIEGEDYTLKIHNNIWYALEKIEYQIPYWIEPYKNFDNVIKNTTNIRTFYDKSINEHIKSDIEYIDTEIDTKYKRKSEYTESNITFPLEEWKNKILEQNDNKFVTLEYVYNNEKKTIQVPEIPFHLWCLGQNAYTFIASDIFHWVPICIPDIKMINDNCYHSDWLLGAGLAIENWYTAKSTNKEYMAIDEAAWDYAYEYTLKMKKLHNIIG